MQGVYGRKSGSASKRGEAARAKAAAAAPAAAPPKGKRGKGPLTGKDPIVMRGKGPKPDPREPMQVIQPVKQGLDTTHVPPRRAPQRASKKARGV